MIQGTTPDLSLATNDIAWRCSWTPGEYLGSDHRTILITYAPNMKSSTSKSMDNRKGCQNNIIKDERKVFVVF